MVTESDQNLETFLRNNFWKNGYKKYLFFNNSAVLCKSV